MDFRDLIDDDITDKSAFLTLFACLLPVCLCPITSEGILIFRYRVRQLLRFFSNVDLGLFEKPESDDLMFSPHAFKANKQVSRTE